MVSVMRCAVFLLALAFGCCTGYSVDGPRRAVVTIHQGDINGKIVFEQATPSSPVKVRGTVYGLEPGLHGMHVHEGKSIERGCGERAVGPHFNPTGKQHGGLRDANRHVGDLGNIKSVAATPVPRSDINIISSVMSLYEKDTTNVMNRVLVIHSNEDDLGRGGNWESQESGNAGGHLACGLITPVESVESTQDVIERFQHSQTRHQIPKTTEHGKKYSKESTEQRWSFVPSGLELENIEFTSFPRDGFELQKSVSTAKVWKVGKIYEYNYNGFITSGIMGVGPKISGGLITAKVILEPIDETTINVALRTIGGKMFNEDVLEEFTNANPGKDVSILDLEHIQKPLSLKIINGRIENVLISKDEPLWTINFKRAIVAQLQLQLDGSSGVFHKEEMDSYYAENTAYHAMEGCTTGECQVWYHISRIPKQQMFANPNLLARPEMCKGLPVYEIVKNRNFDKCTTLPVFNWINNPGLKCDLTKGSGCENQYAHIDMVRILGCKVDQDTFLVQRIKSMDRVVLKPFGYETEALEGLTIQHFELVSVSHKTSQSHLFVPRDVHNINTLVYAYDIDNVGSGPLLSQPTLNAHVTPYVMDIEPSVALKECERLFKEIVADLESNEFYADPSGKYVSDKVSMLRKAITLLDKTKLRNFVEKYVSNTEEWSTPQQIMVDALVLSGTNPAFMIIRDWILNGRLKGEQAVQVISMFPATIKIPTKELLLAFINLLKSDVVAKHQNLKFASALSVTRIVYQACINKTVSTNMFPKMLMGEFCSPHDQMITRQLLPWLNEQLKTATEDVERIAMLAALNNIGHEMILPYVLPHISSCEPSSSYEAQWYERHRRSTPKEEDPMSKKDWRKKWLAHKMKYGKDAKNIEDLLEKFEDKMHEEKEEAKEQKKPGVARGKHEKQAEKEAVKLFKKGRKEEAKLNKSALKEAKKYEKTEQTNVEDMLTRDTEGKKKTLYPETEEEFPDEMDVIKGAGFGESLFNTEYEEEEEEEEEEEFDVYEGIEDKAACNILRAKAIFALSTLAVHKNDVIHKILMPVYFNKAEETEVRLAALSMLFVSNPPVAFWERLALSTWIEPNDQVAHYIYTTIASLVSNKDPKRRDITRRAESVLPMMKPMRWTSLVSSNYLKGNYEENTRLGYLSKTVTFPGYESFIPSNHYHSLYMAYGPWWSRLFAVSINGKQTEKFIDLLLGKPAVRGKGEGEKEHAHPDLSKIHEELKIEARATGQPEVFIYANLMDNYERFFNINPKTIEETVGNWMRSSIERSSKKETTYGYHKFIPLVDAYAHIPSAMGLAYSVAGSSRIFLSVKTRMSGMDFRSLKSGVVNVEGAIKPVFTLEWMTKLSAEIPFTRTYPTAGVHVEMAIALPNRYSIDIDLTAGKMDTSFELIGDKVRIGRHSVIPFTTIRKVGDYTPALLLPQTKPVLLLEEPFKNQKTFGHETLGLNFIWTERGDVQAMQNPASFNEDWFGMALFYVLPSTVRYHECNLILDNTISDTKTIKSSFSFVSKQPEHIRPEAKTYEESLSKSIFGTAASKKHSKGTSRNIAGISEAEKIMHERKLDHLFRTSTDPTGYSANLVVELIGESKVRRFGSSLAYSIGDHGVSHRGNWIFEKEADTETGENFVLCADLNANFPRPSVVRREEIGRDDISRKSTLKIGFGKSCDDRKVLITNTMVRTEEDIPSTTQTKWQERECAKQEIFGRGVSEECLSTRRLAAILNRGVVTIEYNEMPSFVRNATVKVGNMFRYWLGEHMSDNQVDVKNTPNTIRIESVYYPIIGSMDLRVYQPHANTFFHGINLHPITEAVLPFNPRLTAFRAVYGGPGLCLVDRDTVTTYDGLSYNSTIAGCDQVITKDCSGRYLLAVLAREERNKKVVTIYLNREKIELNAALMRVKVNDKEQSLRESGISQYIKDSEGDLIAIVRKTKDGFLILESPSHLMRVSVNPEEIVILNSPVHRGRLCGLCGSQTGEKVTDLMGPKKCALPSDLMSVAYELSHPRGCRSAHGSELKETLARVQEQCRKEEMTTGFGLTERKPLVPKFQQGALSKHIRSTQGGECDLIRNRMIHRGRKRCFSIEPALKCAEGCEPADYEAVQMEFLCVPAGTFSDELKEAMQCRPLDELTGKEATTVTTFRVPTACVPVETRRPKQHGKHHSMLQEQ